LVGSVYSAKLPASAYISTVSDFKRRSNTPTEGDSTAQALITGAVSVSGQYG